MLKSTKKKEEYNPSQYELFLTQCICFIQDGKNCTKVKTYIDIKSDGYYCSTVFIT
jgi:hypothetical protein